MTTLNPSDKNSDLALSGGNLVAQRSTGTGDSFAGVRSTTSKAPDSGKWYYRVTWSGTPNNDGAGIAKSTANVISWWLGADGDSVGWYQDTYGHPASLGYGAGDYIDICLDTTTGSSGVKYSKNGGALSSQVNISLAAYFAAINLHYATGIATVDFAPTGGAAATDGYSPWDAASGTTHVVTAASMTYAGQAIANIRATNHVVTPAAMAYGGQTVASVMATVHAVAVGAMTYGGQVINTVRSTVHVVSAALQSYLGQVVQNITGNVSQVGLATITYAGKAINGGGAGQATQTARVQYGRHYGYWRY